MKNDTTNSVGWRAATERMRLRHVRVWDAATEVIWANQELARGPIWSTVDATTKQSEGIPPSRFDSTVLHDLLSPAGLIAVLSTPLQDSFKYLDLMAETFDSLHAGKDVVFIATADGREDVGWAWRHAGISHAGLSAVVWGPPVDGRPAFSGPFAPTPSLGIRLLWGKRNA